VARASGTAVAIARLRDALAKLDVTTAVFRASSHRSQTIARARFHRELRDARLDDYDAVLGVNGDGWRAAAACAVPFVALLKAFYAGALTHERGVTRALLALHASWEGDAARHADAVVVPSRFAAAAMQRSYGVASPKVHVVPEPFDLDVWRDALPARERDGTRVLCVAHLYPRKRVTDLLAAWPRVRGRRSGARLDVVGGGPELRRLERQARGLDECFLHGHVAYPEILEFYARAGVFCLPSAQETFGYAAVEAMASGLPVVIAGAGALPEICAGAVAETVPVGEPEAIAGAIERAMEGTVRARAAATNPAVTSAFSPARVATLLLDAVAAARETAQRRAAGSDSRSAGSRR
jgi:phosphatidyl-myo-inositol dimannoside synthase